MNKDFSIHKFMKLPKWLCDKYMEMAARDAAYYMQGGESMSVVGSIGFYDQPIAGGYIGWITTIDGTYFIDVDGKITKPDM